METTSLTFGSPLWLWALAALPAVAILHIAAHVRSRSLVGRIVAPRLRAQLAGSVSPARRFFRLALLLLSFTGIILALARPQAGYTEVETKSRGRDVIIAIDTSRSMLATDVPPDRLKRAKLLAQDLIRLLGGDRVGLIAFAGSAFLQAPLTLDYTAVINALEELDTNVIPKGGTNLAAAIAVAETAFGKAEGTTRALVILTDGEELDADGVAAAKRAEEKGIRIFTVGIGSAEGSLIPFRSEDGRQDFVRDPSGKPVQTKLDSGRLEEIARAAGGFFSTLGPDTAREIVQRGIAPLEQTETGVTSSRQPIEKYRWPLGAAIILLFAWMLLTDRRKPQFRPARASVAAVLIACAVGLPAARADGLSSYNAGDFASAGKTFEERLKTQPSSRELQFNSGTAAYKGGDFDLAVKRFTEALLSEDRKLRDDATYNLANSLVRRGEKNQDTEAKKADWKSAIEQYTELLASNPGNKQASENREIVKKLLKDLEQEQQNKDQKQEQQQKEQQNKEQQQDQSKNDKQQDQKDQKKKDQDQQKDGSDSGKQDQQEKTDQKSGDQKKDQQKNEQKNESQNGVQPTPTPGEKKEGDLKSGDDKKQEQQNDREQQQHQAAGQPKEEQEREGEMSPAQARALLNTLRNEEEKVNLIQQPFSQEVLRDW